MKIIFEIDDATATVLLVNSSGQTLTRDTWAVTPHGSMEFSKLLPLMAHDANASYLLRGFKIRLDVVPLEST